MKDDDKPLFVKRFVDLEGGDSFFDRKLEWDPMNRPMEVVYGPAKAMVSYRRDPTKLERIVDRWPCRCPGNTPSNDLVRTSVSEENTEEKPTEAPAQVEEKTTERAKPLLGQKNPKEPRVTVGRVVLYTQHAGDEPHMAHVCKVWSNEVVNLDAIDGNGHHYTVTSVCKGNRANEWRYPTRSE